MVATFSALAGRAMGGSPLEPALKYDTVESHGWYDNLNLTVEQVLDEVSLNELLVDYSGGTGILAQRLLEQSQGREYGVIIADSSPKFWRLALEKFRDEPRLAFRLIRYLKAERRLQSLDEVLELEALGRPVDAVLSTNAIHLYYGLRDTLASWRRVSGQEAAFMCNRETSITAYSQAPGSLMKPSSISIVLRWKWY